MFCSSFSLVQSIPRGQQADTSISGRNGQEARYRTAFMSVGTVIEKLDRIKRLMVEACVVY